MTTRSKGTTMEEKRQGDRRAEGSEPFGGRRKGGRRSDDANPVPPEKSKPKEEPTTDKAEAKDDDGLSLRGITRKAQELMEQALSLIPLPPLEEEKDDKK